MRYVSVFSGIEAATVAWGPLGWEPAAFCEMDGFPSAVLAERFPDVPNLGDVTKVDWKEFASVHGGVDVVVGGSPCQSFSVAGKREGLRGESGLMLEYVRCVREVRPRWFVWENVPGALSSEGGEAFRCLLASMDALGYGLAWRVLDAQFFGVAQRRERVFLVGSLGDRGGAAEVLFEPESLRWDHPSGRDKREELAARAGGGAEGAGGARTLQVRCGKEGGGKGALVQHDMSATLSCSDVQTPFQPAVIDRAAYNQGANARYDPHIGEADVMDTLVARGPHAVGVRDGGYTVRKLTPRECERLQGFEDDWTRVPWRGRPAEECPDTPRYKALGNSMAVPVMRWIGRRMEAADRARRE